jgi:hypothetical protein
MKKTLLYFLLCLSFTGFAQDWAPFKTTDTIRHFVGLNVIRQYSYQDYKPIQSISVDSSHSDTSGLSLFFEKGFSLFKLYDGSAWASEDIIKGRILGDQIQFYQDSLIVSTVDSFGFQLNFPFSYSIGQSFNFASSMNHYITASCDSMYLDSVNGQIDSIAFIRLTVYNQNTIIDSSHHFNCAYRISKNFGLLLTPDFTSLDSLHYYQPYFNLKEQLCNTSFGLSVGDEYHYRRDTNNYFNNGQSIGSSSYGYKGLITADTIVGVSRNISITEQTGSGFPGQYRFVGSRTYSISYDTSVKYCHVPKSAIIHDSLLSIFQAGNYVLLPIYGVDDTKPFFKLFRTQETSNQIIDYNSLSWPTIVDSIFYSPRYSSEYKIHIGLTDTYFVNGYNGNGSSSTSKSLSYIKKGNQTWGTPLNLTVGMEEVNQKGAIKLYPNPASNQIQLGTEERLKSVLVSDVNGKPVEVNRVNNLIDVSNLSSGLYFIQVETENGMFREKFIKQ